MASTIIFSGCLGHLFWLGIYVLDMFIFLEYLNIRLEALDTVLHDYGAIVLAGERCGVELGLCKRIYSLCILV